MRNPREQGKTRARKLVQASVVGILALSLACTATLVYFGGWPQAWEFVEISGSFLDLLVRTPMLFHKPRDPAGPDDPLQRPDKLYTSPHRTSRSYATGHYTGYRRLQVDLFEPRTAEVQSLSSARALISARTRATTITSIASWGFSNTLLRHRNTPFKKPSIRVPFSRPTRQDHCRTFGTRSL